MTTDPKQLDLAGQEVGRAFRITISEKESYTEDQAKHSNTTRRHPLVVRAPGYVEAIEKALEDWHETDGIELTVRVVPE